MVARFLSAVLVLLVGPLSLAAAQGPDTVFDGAGVLTRAQEREVQAAFDRASAESGDPIYAFLVSNTNVDVADRPEILEEKASEAGSPPDAGVIVVDTEDRWALVRVAGDSDQAVYNAMAPHFRDGDFAGGLVAGAAEIRDNLSVLPELLTAAGALGTAAALAGVTLSVWRRRRKQRRREEQRRLAEREYAALTERMDEFGEKERLVAGYLEAQRPLLDRRFEEEAEAGIRDAGSAGFGREFSEAASCLASDPEAARERIASGRRLLEGALEVLSEVESAIDGYRAADESLEDRLRVAADEIAAAREQEAAARGAGARVEPADLLLSEYDRLARVTAARSESRVEFDPREALTDVEALIERARARRAELEAEVSSRAALPEKRSSAEGGIRHARETLEEYARTYGAERERWGPAALEEAPSPEELSARLRHASGAVEHAGRAEMAGSFVEALTLLEEAEQTARAVMQAPGELGDAVAGADRRRREGEEKLRDLEARLEHAKANRHRMSPRQRRELRDYERRLADARGGFFGADWLTALLVFEALDNDYVYLDGAPYATGDGSMEGDDSWGDFGGGDFGGGDFGGGDF